jgi:hypothetical protein
VSGAHCRNRRRASMKTVKVCSTSTSLRAFANNSQGKRMHLCCQSEGKGRYRKVRVRLIGDEFTGAGIAARSRRVYSNQERLSEPTPIPTAHLAGSNIKRRPPQNFRSRFWLWILVLPRTLAQGSTTAVAGPACWKREPHPPALPMRMDEPAAAGIVFTEMRCTVQQIACPALRGGLKNKHNEK